MNALLSGTEAAGVFRIRVSSHRPQRRMCGVSPTCAQDGHVTSVGSTQKPTEFWTEGYWLLAVGFWSLAGGQGLRTIEVAPCNQTRPWRAARAAASRLLPTPSFPSTLETWLEAVRGLM